MTNLTEASFLLDTPYVGEDYDQAYIEDMLKKLKALGAKNVVLTGVSFEKGKLGCACYDGNKIEYTFTNRLDASVHGTGDVFASSFAGALLRGKSILEAATIAQDYVVESMKLTLGDDSHWYGVKFEKAIPFLIERLK